MVRNRRCNRERAAARLTRAAAAAARLPRSCRALARAELEWNLQPPITPMAQQMFDLHSYIFWICVVIFVLVFGVMFYSIFKHRKSVGHQAAQFHENTTVEIVWTVIPFLILLFMAWPATKTILAMKDTSAARPHDQGHRLPVEVGLRLPAGRLRLLLEPRRRRSRRSRTASPRASTTCSRSTIRWSCRSNSKVRLIITANDVLHAWWVPALGVKQDAIPGFVRDSLVQGGEDRHVPRPVRRAVRQGARLHADRRRGEVQGGLREVGRRPEAEGRRRRRRSRTRRGPRPS